MNDHKHQRVGFGATRSTPVNQRLQLFLGNVFASIKCFALKVEVEDLTRDGFVTLIVELCQVGVIQCLLQTGERTGADASQLDWEQQAQGRIQAERAYVNGDAFLGVEHQHLLQ